MHVHRDDTTWGLARYGVRPAGPGPATSSPPDAEQRTTRLIALDHLAAGLRAAGPAATALTWAHVAQCTLAAAQHASTSAPTAGGLLTRRLSLNDALYRAFMVRKHGQRWTTFDHPTLLLAVADLIAAEHTPPTPEP